MTEYSKPRAADSSVLVEFGSGDAWPSFDAAARALEPGDLQDQKAREVFRRLPDDFSAHLESGLVEPGLATPQRIGRFRLVRELGRGRFGIVFLARDDQIDRDVAIKVARPEVVADEQNRLRFGREAELAGSLSHPGIVPIHEVGIDGPWLYIVMGLCDGDTLTEWNKRHPDGCNPNLSARLTKQLAEAIAHGHQRGVVHRDLKPSNIGVIDDDPDINPSDISSVARDAKMPGDPDLRVYDFGLSCGIDVHLRDTRTSLSIGTPLYMAPEQLRGSDVTPAADVYSIGTVLYELLTGRCPFEAETQPEVLHRLWHDEPQPPSELNAEIDRDLEAVCLKALAKRPEDRYATAGELADDLSRWLRGRPTQARPMRWWRRFRLWSERPSRVREAGAVILTQHIVLPAWTLFGQLGPQSALGTLEDGELISTQFGASVITHLFFFVLGLRLWSNRKSRMLMKVGFVVAFSLVPLHLGRGLGWLPAPSGWYDDNPDMRWLIFWLMSLTAAIDMIAITIAMRSERRQQVDRV